MTESNVQEPVQNPEKTKKYNKLVHYIVLLLLSAVSAGAIGSMVGITQYDSVVIAAVVPVLLTAGWGVISLKLTNLKHDIIDHNLIAISVAMILFLYVITYSANYNRLREEQREMKYLENCSNYEYFINEGRNALELPPLESEYFCKK